MLEIIVALVITSVVAYFVLKGYKAQAILIFGGILLMLASILLGKGLPLPEGKSTGSTLLDIFHFITFRYFPLY